MAKRNRENSLREYEDYTEDDAERDSEEQRSSRGGSFFKFPEGKTTIRIVPPPKGEGRKWKEAVMEHFYDVPGVGKVKHACVRHGSKGKRKCLSCERERKLRNGSGADEEAAYDCKAKRRLYANIVVRGQEGEGVRLTAFGPMLEGELTDVRNGGYNFVNPEDGCDIVVIKRTKNNRTTYKAMAANKGRSCPLSDDVDQMNDWIDNATDLRKFSKLLSDEEIEAMLEGDEAPRGRSRDNDRRSSSSDRGRRRSIDDDMDDDDDDEDDDDDGGFEIEDDDED